MSNRVTYDLGVLFADKGVGEFSYEYDPISGGIQRRDYNGFMKDVKIVDGKFTLACEDLPLTASYNYPRKKFTMEELLKRVEEYNVRRPDMLERIKSSAISELEELKKKVQDLEKFIQS